MPPLSQCRPKYFLLGRGNALRLPAAPTHYADAAAQPISVCSSSLLPQRLRCASICLAHRPMRRPLRRDPASSHVAWQNWSVWLADAAPCVHRLSPMPDLATGWLADAADVVSDHSTASPAFANRLLFHPTANSALTPCTMVHIQDEISKPL